MAEPKKDAAKKDAKKKPVAKQSAPKKAPAKTETAAKKPAAKKATAAAKAKPATKPGARKPGAQQAAPKRGAKTPSEAKQPAAKSAAKKGAAAPKAAARGKPKPTAPKTPAERPVVNARARFVRVAPRKARLIADQVRGMPLEDALTLLRFSSRGVAEDISKLIGSAAANAENNHDLVADDLVVSEIRVDEGPTLRRFRPRAQGRATRINKRTSHIHVALTPED